jgi:hypothetical protein
MQKWINALLTLTLTTALLTSLGCKASGSEGPKTRISFDSALEKCAKDGFVVIEQSKSGDTGYAILGDSTPPKNKIAFALFAICHDDFYLGADKETPVWACVIRFNFNIENNTLTTIDIAFDRGLRPDKPIMDTFKIWEPKWNEYLRGGKISLSDDGKTQMNAVLQAISTDMSNLKKAGSGKGGVGGEVSN